MKPPPKQSLRFMYVGQRRGAAHRGIEFLLTFEEWLQIWENSGHLAERGARKGCYVMARFGDKGPYAVGNVKIILHEENSRERRMSEKGKAKIRKANAAAGVLFAVGSTLNRGRVHSAESRVNFSKGQIGNTNRRGKPASQAAKEKMRRAKLGRVLTEETKAKMSEAHKRRWAKLRGDK